MLIARDKMIELEKELVGALTWCPDCDEYFERGNRARACPICDDLTYNRQELTIALRTGHISYICNTGIMAQRGRLCQ